MLHSLIRLITTFILMVFLLTAVVMGYGLTLDPNNIPKTLPLWFKIISIAVIVPPVLFYFYNYEKIFKVGVPSKK